MKRRIMVVLAAAALLAGMLVAPTAAQAWTCSPLSGDDWFCVDSNGDAWFVECPTPTTCVYHRM